MNPGLSDATVDSDVAEAVDTEAVAPLVHRGRQALRAVRALLVLAAAGFLALHFIHLSADFPNHSPWMDWSKYTDEGWYGDAAIRQLQLGHWFVRGDFNPAAALPVWPGLEFLLFSLTGVSLAAARALSVSVFGGILVASYLLLRRFRAASGSSAQGGVLFAPAAAVALLAVSPFCYAFTRLAILEPLLILLMLLALLAASSARRSLAIAGVGALVPLMILTKTTAVFLLPALAWMIWASCGYRMREFLRVGVPAAAIAAGLWCAYFFLLVRPRFLEDYRYLFSANAYTGMTRENAWSVIEDTVRDGVWMGRLIYPLALAAAVLALLVFRRCLRNPLVPSLMLWAAGYAGFLAYHNNLQPRYYLVIAVPLTLLATVVFEEVFYSAGKARGPVIRGVLTVLAAAAFLAVFVTDAKQTIGFVRAPEYTFTRAAAELSRIVRADKTHRPLVLSISGSDISLMTGLPSICDDFGTMTLEDRVALYRPGWYATWNQVDDDKMEALAPLFHLVRVASFMAFDDPDRNLLILYRLDPSGAEEPPRKKKRRPVPKQLQTKIGQQPSANQLEH